MNTSLTYRLRGEDVLSETRELWDIFSYHGFVATTVFLPKAISDSLIRWPLCSRVGTCPYGLILSRYHWGLSFR